MSRIRSTGTNPELIIEKFLKDLKIKYKKHYKKLPGSPDFYLPEIDSVIYVHGCFWHAHKNCRYFRIPLSNQEFWKKKFKRNVTRDKENEKAIDALNVPRLTVWGCEIVDATFLDKILDFVNYQASKR